MIESDEVLMKQFQGGDEKAFIALMERYQQKIFNFFLRQCHDFALTEELTQDIFMRLFKYGKSYDCAREFKPWFYKIALNMIRRAPEIMPETC